MYSEIFYHGFFNNFILSTLFIVFNLYFSFLISYNIKGKALFKDNRPILIFFSIFLIYSAVFNYLILFKLENIIKLIFYIILFLQILFTIFYHNKNNFKILKKIHFKKLNGNFFLVLIFLGFFLLAILPITDADSVSSHLNFAAKIIFEKSFPADIPKDIEFVSYSNSEVLLLISGFLTSDNFGAQLNFFTLILFLYFFFNKNKTFFYLLISCPLIILFVSTQKLQLFYAILYLYLFILILNKKNFNKIEILSICFLTAFYASGKMSYIIIALPLFVFFLFKNFKNIKIIIYSSFLAFVVILFPIFFNKFIYYFNPVAPFLDSIIGQNNFFLEVYSDTLRSQAGWLSDKRLIIFLKPFIPIGLNEMSTSLGLFFILLFNKNLLIKTKYFPLLIVILIFLTGQATARYYFEAFLILIFFVKFKKTFYKKIIYLQAVPIFIFTFCFIYMAYIKYDVLIDKDKYLSKFSYTFYNSKVENNLNIKKNILNTASRGTIFTKNNHFNMRFLSDLKQRSGTEIYEKYFVKYINDYNIDYVIGQSTEIPECLKFKKVDQFLFKNVRRNFLLKEGVTNFNLYKITNRKCE